MKIASIGDLHGHSSWKALVEGFDPATNTGTGYHINKFDKIIFIGDYVDSFSVTNIIMKHNLSEIIQMKKKYLKKIVLLFGNHDLQYYFMSDIHRCTGYRPEMQYDFYDLFRKNENLFDVAFQYKNYIWTHAGIHVGWNKMRLQPWIDMMIKEGESEKTISEWINLAFKMNKQFLYDCSFYRGGYASVGGPFWLDKNESYKKPLRGYHQIVGHTVVDTIKTYEKAEDTSITYIDCLGRDMYNFHIIDI